MCFQYQPEFLLQTTLIVYKFTYRSSSTTKVLVSSRICQGVSGLTPLQKSMCSSNPSIFVSMATAIVRASEECQWHFRWKRWNCFHGNNTKKLFFPQELSIRELFRYCQEFFISLFTVKCVLFFIFELLYVLKYLFIFINTFSLINGVC